MFVVLSGTKQFLCHEMCNTHDRFCIAVVNVWVALVANFSFHSLLIQVSSQAFMCLTGVRISIL